MAQELQKSQSLDFDQMFKLYSDVVAPGLNMSREEFTLHVDYCNKRKLDPLGKDVYWVRRQSKINGQWKTILTPQGSIDSFRKRALRHPEYEGQEGPFWCGEDGVWRDVWLSSKPPAACKVGIWRKRFRNPLWATVKFSEYAQKDKDGNLTKFWRDMAANQIAKCAEELAIRRAFPEEFGGEYGEDEMEQASNPPVVMSQAPKLINSTFPPTHDDETNASLNELMKQLISKGGMFEKHPVNAKKWIISQTGKKWSQIHAGDVHELMAQLEEDVPDDLDAPVDDMDAQLAVPDDYALPEVEQGPVTESGVVIGKRDKGVTVKEDPRTQSVTEDEIIKMRLAFRRTGMKKDEMNAAILNIVGPKKPQEWSRTDFEALKEFVGKAYQ